jgi:transposase
VGCVGADRPGIDLGEGRRRWRALDLGTTFAFVESDAPRVTCRRHGVVVCAVPWARHDSRFTRAFEDQVCWLAVNCSKTAVAELMRVAWRSVGAILERACAEATREIDLLDGLRRIGIDEISHRKGHRYLTVVVDHHTGRLVWAAPGRDRKTVLAFFDQLGEERCTQVELVSADMAVWISGPIAERVPHAVRCVDPFHVVMLATEALDDVRREVWNEARRQGNRQLARELKGARFAVWKNPENLTDRQQAKLATIQHTNARLYRAYLLKEQLRQIYRLPAAAAERLLDRWLVWARRCRLPSLREARQNDHRAARRDHRRDRARALQRPDRTDQHPDPPDRPQSLRVPLAPGTDRPRDAQTRRPLPTATTVTRPTETSGDSVFGTSRLPASSVWRA